MSSYPRQSSKMKDKSTNTGYDATSQNIVSAPKKTILSTYLCYIIMHFLFKEEDSYVTTNKTNIFQFHQRHKYCIIALY